MFRQLAQDEPALAGLVDWAQRHHAIVARFGRFPHRNALLGQPSTDEEVAFLQASGSGFCAGARGLRKAVPAAPRRA